MAKEHNKQRAQPRALTRAEMDAFGQEMDAIRARVMNAVGKKDADYIRSMMRLQKRAEIGGRVALMMGWNPIAWVAGTGMLSFAKILENMEIGHNVMHGQYNWMNEPTLNGNRYDWDNVCPGGQWRHSHNYMHHTFTNIVGKDRDVGYGLLRMGDKQAWEPKYRAQPLYAFLLMIFFEWGAALHDLEFEKVQSGEKSLAQFRKEFMPILKKISKQGLKDYALFPLLAGPAFLPVLAGNIVANIVRNIWAFLIIFCGHFTDDVAMYTEEETQNESHGQWYIRQLRGSSNLSGGKWFHIMSGNLSHQIEHHLFPDMPSHRYAEVAPEIRALCHKYGQHYNTGTLWRQFSTVAKRIATLSLPNGKGVDLQFKDKLDSVATTSGNTGFVAKDFTKVHYR